MKFLFRVTAWERAAWWRRSLGAVGRVALLICVLNVLSDLFGPPVVAYVMLRKVEQIHGVYVTPEPLKDYSVSSARGARLSYFGYSFEVPWTGVSIKQESPHSSRPGGIVVFSFSSGQSLVFIVPGDQSGLLAEIAHDKDMGGLGPLFGDLVKRSPYDQYSALLNMSPSQIRLFGPSGERARGVAMLTVKALALPGAMETGAYSFELQGKRGFQLGEPSKSERVQLEVLDLNGHYVEICMATKKNIHFTQPEINRILATLRVVPPDVASPSAKSTADPSAAQAARCGLPRSG